MIGATPSDTADHTGHEPRSCQSKTVRYSTPGSDQKRKWDNTLNCKTRRPKVLIVITYGRAQAKYSLTPSVNGCVGTEM